LPDPKSASSAVETVNKQYFAGIVFLFECHLD
jgi:hypothetical protein